MQVPATYYCCLFYLKYLKQITLIGKITKNFIVDKLSLRVEGLIFVPVPNSVSKNFLVNRCRTLAVTIYELVRNNLAGNLSITLAVKVHYCADYQRFLF